MRPITAFCFMMPLALLLASSIPSPAWPAAPGGINFQGLILDATGSPVNGQEVVTLAIWADLVSTAPADLLYQEIHVGVDVIDGVFSVVIGQGGLPSGAFDEAVFLSPDTWLETTIGTETMSPRQKLQSVAYALQSEQSESATHADTAGDADTVDGSHAADLNQSAHVSATGNPHGVTAAQTGGATAIEVSAAVAGHAVDASAHHARYADAEAVSAVLLADGSGSGLDADLLDGQEGSAFATAGHQHAGLYLTRAEIENLVAARAPTASYVEDRNSINDFAETSFTPVTPFVNLEVRWNSSLMVWANLNAEYDITSPADSTVDLECQVAVNGIGESIIMLQEFADVLNTSNSGESIAITTLTPIPAGTQVKVNLECRKAEGVGMVFIKHRSLSTLLVPTP